MTLVQQRKSYVRLSPLASPDGCPERTNSRRLLDHLVGATEHGRGHRDAEHLCVFRLKTISNLLAACTGNSPDLAL